MASVACALTHRFCCCLLLQSAGPDTSRLFYLMIWMDIAYVIVFAPVSLYIATAITSIIVLVYCIGMFVVFYIRKAMDDMTTTENCGFVHPFSVVATTLLAWSIMLSYRYRVVRFVDIVIAFVMFSDMWCCVDLRTGLACAWHLPQYPAATITAAEIRSG